MAKAYHQTGLNDGLLTPRERQVLWLLGPGKTTKEISLILSIGYGTISAHRKALCRKLHTHSTAELIQLATVVTAGWLRAVS
jgi:DNA-binding CsgD family transcriptional regulator